MPTPELVTLSRGPASLTSKKTERDLAPGQESTIAVVCANLHSKPLPSDLVRCTLPPLLLAASTLRTILDRPVWGVPESWGLRLISSPRLWQMPAYSRRNLAPLIGNFHAWKAIKSSQSGAHMPITARTYQRKLSGCCSITPRKQVSMHSFTTPLESTRVFERCLHWASQFTVSRPARPKPKKVMEEKIAPAKFCVMASAPKMTPWRLRPGTAPKMQSSSTSQHCADTRQKEKLARPRRVVKAQRKTIRMEASAQPMMKNVATALHSRQNTTNRRRCLSVFPLMSCLPSPALNIRM
mmetsp:Transcript_2696/g.6330  ORF Transcript_2696/g.6330 Transcript_2696/m.6330 type:complete len:296 (+) Transcript_2696:150-1037(+)